MGAAREGAGMSFWDIIFFGVATRLRRVSALGCHLHEIGRGWSPLSSQNLLLHFGSVRVSPPESLIPGTPKECAVSVHPDVFASLGNTGGSRRELLGYHLPWRVYRTLPRFSTWLPPS